MAKGGHACQSLRHQEGNGDHTIIVFGGGDAYGVSYNDILAIEPDRCSSWRCTELQPTNTGVIPQRMGHSSVKVPTRHLQQRGGPAERAASVAQSVEDDEWSTETMLIFGGYQAVPDAIYYNDTYAIAVRRNWSELVGTWRAPPLVSVTKVGCTGTAPSPRHSHASSVNASGSVMLIVGGAAEQGNVTRDCFELNLITKQWREVILPGHHALRFAREMSSCAFIGDDTGRLLLLGGRDAAGNLNPAVGVLRISGHDATEEELTAEFDSSDAVPDAPLVCCHTTVQLAPWVALSIGGLTPEGISNCDTLLVSSTEGSVGCVPIPRTLSRTQGGEVTQERAPNIFGFGHSGCSWRPTTGLGARHIVLTGLAPDAASGVLSLFELQTV